MSVVVLVRPKSVEVSGVQRYTIEGSTVGLLCEVSDIRAEFRWNIFCFQLSNFIISIERYSDEI